jgi:hypothetical protein
MGNSFIKEFEIKLNRREYIYRPGDKIKGELHINLTKELLLKHVNVVFVEVFVFEFFVYKYGSD